VVANSPAVSFLAKIEHGCLILRDAGSDDDISDWDPTSSSWYQQGSSLIFGVQAAVDGPVECEVWKSAPPAVLPASLFEVSLPCPSGWLVLHDPNDHARMQFTGFRNSAICSTMVDDLQFPAKVQILLREEGK
jgi:hypothetical protein